MEITKFVKRVVKQFNARKGVFANKVNVEDWVPKKFSAKKKAMFLFLVTQLDYAIKSVLLYEGATKLVKDKPNFFSAEAVVAMSDEELTELLTTYLRPRYVNEAVKRYKLNAQVLLDEYKGDPRNIFKDKSASKVVKKVLKFRGFGPKTGNLFFRSMVNIFGLKFDDIGDVLPPVDMHDVRIAYYMGYVDSNEMTQKNVTLVKHIWGDACKKAKVNWMTFDMALWLLGSQGLPKSKEDVLKLIDA